MRKVIYQLPKYVLQKEEVMATTLASDISGTEEININLNPAHKVLLKWNYRLFYVGFKHIQFMVHSDFLKVQGYEKWSQVVRYPNDLILNMVSHVGGPQKPPKKVCGRESSGYQERMFVSSA